MGIVLKGEKSLEGKIKRKKDAKEKLQEELKENKKELKDLRKKQLFSTIKDLIKPTRDKNKEEPGEKILQYKEKINSTSREIDKLEEEIAGLIKGHQGEEHVTSLLKSELEDEFYILNGKKFETSSKNPHKPQKAEIDHIIIGPKGVICVEVKNMSGRFYYEEDGGGWLKAPFPSPNSLKVPMQSPLKQIERATSILKEFINEKIVTKIELTPEKAGAINFYPIAVFTNEKCILHGVKNRWTMPTPLLLKDELVTYIHSLPTDPHLNNKEKASKLAHALVETSK